MTTAPATLPLVARTRALPDPGPLLALLPDPQALVWLRRGEGIVGWGEAARIEAHGPHRFTAVADAWCAMAAAAVVRDEVGLPGTGPVAFGSFSFADDSPAGACLIVPEVVVGRRGGQWWVTTLAGNAVPAPVPPLPQHGPVPGPGAVSLGPGSLPPTHWRAAVTEAITAIQAGRLDKVVLAREEQAHCEHPVDPRAILPELARRYPDCWTFHVDGLFGATPELLVRVERGMVHSRVLAGTIRRSEDETRDLALAASLARSSKDLEEHEFAVRSVAEALSPHCTGTNVPDAPYVLHLANVMHLATDVTGVLRPGTPDPATAIRLAGSLHPSAAVCGTPTAEAAALIAQLEQLDRARYSGPVGWVDAGGDGEWGIALRCAEIVPEHPQRLRLFAGCGIVAGSNPDAELAESAAKLEPMHEALALPTD